MLDRRDFISVVLASMVGDGLQAVPVRNGLKPLPYSGQVTAERVPQTYASVVEDVVASNHILADQNVLDGFGHVSARDPRNANRYLLARSVAPALVTAADIIEYDLDSAPQDAKGRTSYRERFIHGAIYRARRDVMAIVHCHAPSLIPFADTRIPLRAMYHQAAFVAFGVPVYEIRQASGNTNMLVEDAQRGRALATVLADKPALLMRGHGAVIVANSVPTVTGRSIYLDINARAQQQAMALGRPFVSISLEEAQLYEAGSNYDRAWELWRSKTK